MKLRKVDPKSIKVPEVRVTAQFDEDLYEQFKSSIKEVGQITPPICYEVDRELILCDGLHRLQEAIACLLYTSPSPRDQRGSRMPSSA